MHPIRNALSKKLVLLVVTIICAIFATAVGVPYLLHAQDNNQHSLFLPIIAGPGQDSQAADTSAAQVEIPEQYKGLLDKARQTGSVMVIVGLALPNGFQAEGDLGNAAAITNQRAVIAQTRQALLHSLGQYNVNAYATYETIPAMGIKVDVAGLRALLASFLVTTIEEDVSSAPTLASSTVVIGAPVAWSAGYEGAGQTVVILDSGIDGDHPFFGNRIVTQACFSNDGGAAGGVSLCPNGKSSQTGSGAAEAQITACNNGVLCAHGTHVAGIAAGDGSSFDGVARKANIIAIQVFTRFNKTADCAPNPAPCLLSKKGDQLQGLDYINRTLSTNYKIAAANMSLGGTTLYTDQNKCNADNSQVKTAIDNIRSKGIATIIASGNYTQVNAISAPACISTAVAVGATTDADAVASFSNMHAMVDLLAPGVSIDSSFPGGGFANGSGTSQAAPHVTGAWAILKAITPTASVDTILSTLQSTGLSVKDTRPGGTITKPRIRLDKAIPQKPAAPGNLRATALDATRIQLNWQDNSNNETGFKIERCQGAGCTSFTQIATVAANVTTYVNTGLTAGTTYVYRVRANNGSGDSAYSNTASATTTGAFPAAPSNLRATALDSARIQLNWQDNSNNEKGFSIYDGGTFVANVGVGVVAYTATGLAPSSYHCYHLFAYNDYGNSAWTDWACAITAATPTGFDSQFNGSAPGWWIDSGSWAVDANFLTSAGLVNKFATVHQEGDYSNFDFETSVWRNGCDNCSSDVFFRGTPTPLDSRNFWDKGYVVTLNRNQYYAVWSITGGKETALQGWTFTSALNQGNAWNVVRIVAVGSSIRLYLNGTSVWSGTNTLYTSGKVGLGVYQDGTSGNQIWFDYAKLTPTTVAAALTTEEVSGEQQALNAAANAQSDNTGADIYKSKSLPNNPLPNVAPPLANGLDGVSLPASSDASPTDAPERTGEIPAQGSANQRIYLPIIEAAEGSH